MTDLNETISDWSQNGAVLVLARVVKTWGSSPRPIGSMMIINKEGKISGSVSGGCVEGAVVKKSKGLFLLKILGKNCLLELVMKKPGLLDYLVEVELKFICKLLIFRQIKFGALS